MWPLLYQSDTYQLGTYGVMVAVAMLLALYVARLLAPRDGLSPREVNDIGLGVLFFGFLGSKALGLLIPLLAGDEVTMAELRTAGAVHGGVFGGMVAAYFLARWSKVPLRPLIDTYIPAVALGQAIGRLGCLAAGCCFGSPTDAAWGITFENPDAAHFGGVPLHQSLHPVQLYDAALHLVLFGVLFAAHKRGLFRGRLIAPWAIAEGTIRFLVEGFRGDAGRGIWFDLAWLSTGRLTALLLIALGVYLLRRLEDLPEGALPEENDASGPGSTKQQDDDVAEGAGEEDEDEDEEKKD